MLHQLKHYSSLLLNWVLTHLFYINSNTTVPYYWPESWLTCFTITQTLQFPITELSPDAPVYISSNTTVPYYWTESWRTCLTSTQTLLFPITELSPDAPVLHQLKHYSSLLLNWVLTHLFYISSNTTIPYYWTESWRTCFTTTQTLQFPFTELSPDAPVLHQLKHYSSLLLNWVLTHLFYINSNTTVPYYWTESWRTCFTSAQTPQLLITELSPDAPVIHQLKQYSSLLLNWVLTHLFYISSNTTVPYYWTESWRRFFTSAQTLQFSITELSPDAPLLHQLKHYSSLLLNWVVTHLFYNNSNTTVPYYWTESWRTHFTSAQTLQFPITELSPDAPVLHQLKLYSSLLLNWVLTHLFYNNSNTTVPYYWTESWRTCLTSTQTLQFPITELSPDAPVLHQLKQYSSLLLNWVPMHLFYINSNTTVPYYWTESRRTCFTSAQTLQFPFTELSPDAPVLHQLKHPSSSLLNWVLTHLFYINSNTPAPHYWTESWRTCFTSTQTLLFPITELSPDASDLHQLKHYSSLLLNWVLTHPFYISSNTTVPYYWTESWRRCFTSAQTLQFPITELSPDAPVLHQLKHYCSLLLNWVLTHLFYNNSNTTVPYYCTESWCRCFTTSQTPQLLITELSPDAPVLQQLKYYSSLLLNWVLTHLFYINSNTTVPYYWTESWRTCLTSAQTLQFSITELSPDAPVLHQLKHYSSLLLNWVLTHLFYISSNTSVPYYCTESWCTCFTTTQTP